MGKHIVVGFQLVTEYFHCNTQLGESVEAVKVASELAELLHFRDRQLFEVDVVPKAFQNTDVRKKKSRIVRIRSSLQQIEEVADLHISQVVVAKPVNKGFSFSMKLPISGLGQLFYTIDFGL